MKVFFKIALLSIFLILYLFNSYICEYFYPVDVNAWWYLRWKIYAILFFTPFLYLSIEVKNKYAIFLERVILGFLSADMILFVFLDKRSFSYWDIVGACLVIILEYRSNIWGKKII